MKVLARVILLGCVALMSEVVWSQVAPVAAPTSVDTAKQIAAMEATLADWPQLGRYKADNATLAAAAAE